MSFRTVRDGNPDIPPDILSGSYEWPFDWRKQGDYRPRHSEVNKDDAYSARGQMINGAGASNFLLAADLATRHTEMIGRELMAMPGMSVFMGLDCSPASRWQNQIDCETGLHGGGR